MKLVYLSSLLLFIACNKPECNNKNAVFAANLPGSAAYDAELVKQMKTQGVNDTKFWIEGYEEKDGKEYMNVEMQAKDMCAHMRMDITGNERLAQLREVKGSGYSGAELEGLKVRIENADVKTNFIFEDVKTIVD